MSAGNDIRKTSDNFYAALNTTLNRNWTTHGECMVTYSRRLHDAPTAGTEFEWEQIRVS
jgi:hypothetical protein